MPAGDGLGYFNRMYQLVTDAVTARLAASAFADPAWIAQLDVTFGNLYLDAVRAASSGAPVARAWDALLERRFDTGLAPLQLALAGMNAHINHDLAFALLRTNADRNVASSLASPQHADFEHVNGLLENTLPEALTVLATGPLGEAAEDSGKIGRYLAIWNVRVARDFAWSFADDLRTIGEPFRDVAIDAQDRMTGVLGRSLLFSA